MKNMKTRHRSGMAGTAPLRFRLHSEGNNLRPYWGIAFRRSADVQRAIDMRRGHRPATISIEFPNGVTYKFGIRNSSWNGCYEIVDAKEITKSRPIYNSAIVGLGYSVATKGACNIEIQVIKHNFILRITKFV